jgi:hypothetical protein
MGGWGKNADPTRDPVPAVVHDPFPLSAEVPNMIRVSFCSSLSRGRKARRGLIRYDLIRRALAGRVRHG